MFNVMIFSNFAASTLQAIGWLVLLIILLVIEFATVGLTTIWFAGGALVAFILAAMNVGFWVQIVVFLVLSLVLLFFTRPFAVKYINSRRTRTNSEELIGQTVKVIQRIDNRSAEGQAFVNGLEWTARAVSDEMIIEADTLVKVIRIEGVKLIVEPLCDEQA